MYFFVTHTVGYIMSCDYNAKNMIQRTTIQFHYDEKQSMKSKTSMKKQKMLVSGQTIYRGILFIIITFLTYKKSQNGRDGLVYIVLYKTD